MSKIELGVRYTASIWRWLHEKAETVPAPARWPTGVRLPPSSEETASASDTTITDGRSPAGKKTTEKEGEVSIESP